MADSILNTILQYFAPKSSTPNVTYGPAETRIGHFPIDFGDAPSNDEGITYPTTSLKEALVNYFTNRPTSGPIIHVNPSSDTPTTIHHETVHALLDSIGSNKLAQLNQNNPAYTQALSKQLNVPVSSSDTLSDETPAYVFSNDPMLHDKDAAGPIIQPNWLDSYENKLLQQLHALNPDIANGLAQVRQASWGKQAGQN
jgi:hypothetical protein